MRWTPYAAVLLLVPRIGLTADPKKEAVPNPGGAMLSASTSKTAPGRYAHLKTSHGTVVCELFPDKAPATVENFVGLATGEKAWRNPRTGEEKKARLYDGLAFHRVIPGFMIQGGDPLGTGMGGPGYQFEDEIVPDLIFDRPGRLAMANAGPGTNGSQFFITLAPTPWLNGRHTIFGQVVSGQNVIETISKVQRDGNDKPLKPVVLQKVDVKETP